MLALNSKFFASVFTIAAALAVFAGTPARADIPAGGSGYVLQQAMQTDDHVNLYTPGRDSGFNLSGSFFSGLASGTQPLAKYTDPTSNTSFEQAAALEGDQRVYALLIDGSYDFNYDFGSGLPVHPYVKGGAGMAMADPSVNAGAYAIQGGDAVPLFRVGGGVTYRLGEQWNLALDYKAGFSSGMTAGDQVFTGRSQQPVDLQVLNMGMHYEF
jgi:hypothetical protein